MTQLVIGSKGQVGSALIEVLSEKYEVSGIDINESIPHQFDVLHICIPSHHPLYRTSRHVTE